MSNVECLDRFWGIRSETGGKAKKARRQSHELFMRPWRDPVQLAKKEKDMDWLEKGGKAAWKEKPWWVSGSAGEGRKLQRENIV